MLGFERVDRAWHARLHIAESAGAGAGVAEDHHRRMLLGPAFADVRASRLLAHRREIELAHQAPRGVITFADWRLDSDPVGLALPRRKSCRGVHAAQIATAAAACHPRAEHASGKR